jgi:arsenate reductase
MTIPPKILVLSYAACGTCKKALAWLRDQGLPVDVRPITERPPTRAELDAWIDASGLPVRRWLNTSGQSYRALGKSHFDACTDDQIRDHLTKDGKLVKRPVVVAGERVLVGFDARSYQTLVGPRT